MKRFFLFVVALVATSVAIAAEKSYMLTSPDGRVSAAVCVGDKITYSVVFDGKTILAPSQIALHLVDGEVLGVGDRLVKSKNASVDRVVLPQFYFRTEIADCYNELIDINEREIFAYAFKLGARLMLAVIGEKEN